MAVDEIQQELRQIGSFLGGGESALKSLVGCLGDGVAIVDRRHRILFSNRAFIDMYGPEAEETCRGALGHEGDECRSCPAHRVFAGEALARAEEITRDRDGRSLCVEIVATPLLDQQGEIVAAVEVVHDITERKAAERLAARRCVELSTLNAVIEAASQSLDLEQTIRDSVAKLFEVTKFTVGAVMLLDRQGQALDLAFSVGLSPETARASQHLSLRDFPYFKLEELDQPVSVLEQRRYPSFLRPIVEREGLRSLLLVPLRAKRTVVGLMALGRHGEERLSEPEVELYRSIGHSLGLAIENARLFEAERRRAQQYSALLDVALTTGSTLDLSQVLDHVVERVARVTQSDRSSILLLTEDRRRLLPSAMYGMEDNHFLAAWKSQILAVEDEALSRDALSTGEAVVVDDAETDPRTNKEVVRFFGDKSMLVIPLVSKSGQLGTMFLNHIKERHHYSQQDVDFAVAVAGQVAGAIENARLYRESERKSEELLASFQRVGEALATSLDLDETLRLIADLAADITRAGATTIHLLDPDRQELVICAASGLVDDGSAQARLKAGRGLPGKVAETGEVVHISDLLADDLSVDYRLIETEGLRSFLGVPLMLRGEVVGVLSVYRRGTSEFSAADIELLASFANQAAVAISNAQLFASLQSRLRELSGLSDISLAFGSLTNLDETFGRLVELIADLLGVENCVILLLDESAQELVAQAPAFGLSPEQVDAYRVALAEGGAAVEVWNSGVPYLTNSPSASARTHSFVHWFEERSLLIVPMRVGDQTIGLIRASNKREGGFTETDAKLLTIFATEAAVIIQNSILFDRVNREREQLEAMFNSSSDAIMVVNRSGRIVAVNPAFEQMTGWTAAEAAGLHCEELHRGSAATDAPACEMASPLVRAMDEMHVEPYVEGVVVTRNGETRDVTASYSLIPGPDGEVLQGVAILRDISRLKEVERMKSDFLSMVSHELRTPLSLIKGYAATLTRPNLALNAETARRFLVGIDEATDRLARLVDDVLNVSRIEAGRFKFFPQVVNLRDVLEKAVGQMQMQTTQHTLHLAVREAPIKVRVDRAQIHQVMENLLGNAIKYSPRGGEIDVHVQVQRGVVTVSVKDPGLGIPKEHLERIFEKFHRVDSGPSRRAPGFGLGLYISRTIIEAHGGRIWAESGSQDGSTFSFTLPVAGDEA